jgi:hypothetical protein
MDVPVPPAPFAPGESVSYKDGRGKMRSGFKFIKSGWRERTTKADGKTMVLMHQPGFSRRQLRPAKNYHHCMEALGLRGRTKPSNVGCLQTKWRWPGTFAIHSTLFIFIM